MNIKILAIMFLCAGFLFAQLTEGFLDNYILDCDIKDKNQVLVSPSGINWHSNITGWNGFSGISAFGASVKYNFDNSVIGYDEFAVRLDQKDDNIVAFFVGNFAENKTNVIEYTYKNAANQHVLYGFDGCSYDDEFYFAMGDGGIAVIKDGEVSQILETGKTSVSANEYVLPEEIDLSKRVVSVSIDDGKLYATSADGSVWYFTDDSGEWTKKAAIQLKKDEYPYQMIRYDCLLTTDTTTIGKERIYNIAGEKYEEIYTGDIAKIAVSSDNLYFYIVENSGNLIVLDINGKESEKSKERLQILHNGFEKSNPTANYILTDISVSGNSLAFASDKGLFYSANDGNSFEFINKSVPLKSSLKEIYAEPGIITTQDNICTFEYSLAEEDRVTIDIFNYNLDFVCRIIENEIRPASTDNKHSTNRQQDKWDGTVNNSGGRVVPAGVYYFKITTQKGKKSATGKMVVAK